MSSSSIHIHNAPIMHRVYHNPPSAPYIRNHNPYQITYPASYYSFPPGYDPTVSLAHPYIYDPTHIKHRRRTTPEQLKILEDTFKTDPKPNPTLRKQLSVQLGMSPRVLQVWFQNRRMKVKRLAKKQSAAEQRLSSPDAEHKEQDQSNDPPSSSPTESPAKSPSSLPSSTPLSADLAESSSCSPDASTGSPDADAPSASADRPGPPPELAGRRGSLPVLTSTFTFALNDHLSSPVTPSHPDRPRPGSSSVFEGVTDPALFRRRSMTSLHRLESHPYAPLVAASNGIHPSPDHQRQDFLPIIPPSLPPTFRNPRLPGSAVYHHHSPSTPAPGPMMGAMPQTNRAASFHVIPTEHRLHAFPHQHGLMHPPYAFPPRPVPTPGPGPLPAADYSFGTSTPPRGEETQEEFDVRPYVPSVSTTSYSVQATAAAAAGVAFSVPRLVRPDDDTDGSTSYTGYSSRFGSIASVAESDTSAGASVSGTSVCGNGTTSVSSASGSGSGSGSAGAWDGGDNWVEEGRRGSWTGQVAEMLSGLVVTGDTGKAEEMTYENMWDASPNVEHHALYASSSSQESLGVYTHNAAAGSGREDESGLTYPSGEDSTPPGPTAQSRYTTSYSSELAYALCGVPESNNNKQQQQQQHQQAYSASAQGQGGDEILEMHHALAAFTEHPSSGDLSVPYSMGTFVTPEHDGDMPYNMY